ncbi:MAG: hypothetical protein BWK73_31190 [Thiothrix lacustris]|uniref:DUF4435 domain-containing protein n=1 Tax=Thiothrix lacustris TaxID=525917 RepID=A0A1Y1QIK2_9GAMM|nr:MAG: hypothetical protein BWK73_31190 [Thiothrix lacustris]
MNIKSARKPGVIVSEIELLKETHDGGFLLVEGDSDSKFWKHHVDKKRCNIRIAGNKPSVLGAAKKLDEKQDLSSMGIVDADFDRVNEIDYGIGRVVMTDHHDLEMLLVKSRALERVLCGFVNEDALSGFENKQKDSILDYVLSISLIWGRLRYLHVIEQYSFEFDFSPYKYIPKNSSLQVNVDNLYSDFCIKSTIPLSVLHEKLLVVPTEPLEDMIQGHDLLEVLFIVLREIGCEKTIKKGNDLSPLLHLAFHSDDLCKTTMFQSLKQLDTTWNLNMLPDCA